LKKILVLNYEFPPLGGGAGLVTENISKSMSHKYDITVLTTWFKGLPKIIKVDGYHIKRIFAFRTQKGRCYVWQMLAFIIMAFIPALIFCVKNKPALIHAHAAVPTAVLAYLIYKILGIPYIITLHGGDVPSYLPEETSRLFLFIKPLTKPIWKNASQIIAVSDFLQKMAIHDYPLIKVKSIYNGIDSKFFFPKTSQYDKNCITLLFAGRFTKQKNLLLLIDALSKLELDWKLHLIGEGPTQSSIINKLKYYHLEERVILHGWQNREYVRDMMQKADIFVLPSIVESFGMVVLESIACGTPVLVADIPVLREIVEKTQYGIVVKNWNEDLATAIKNTKNLALNRELLNEFAWENIAEAYAEIYQDLI